MKKIYITRKIPDVGVKMLTDKGYEVDVNPENKMLSKSELVEVVKAKEYDAVLTLLTDTIDAEVFDAVPTAKIVSNYAVGFNNIDVVEATKRGVVVTNTPGMSSETVAEHTVALILSLTRRLDEGDIYVREGKYAGWDPMLLWGIDLKDKTVGILGLGRIGSRVGHILSRGFEMKVVYYDVQRNEQFEKDYGAVFCATPEELLKTADVVTVHVPLLPTTQHLLNASHFALMKKTAYLVNTSRGPVIDEVALVEALKSATIAGAGLDVYENEPALAPGLADLPNVVLTPHIASATEETRDQMATLAAQNIIDFFETGSSKNAVKM